MRLGPVVALVLVGMARCQSGPPCSLVRGVVRALELAKSAADADLQAGLKACDATPPQGLETLNLTPRRMYSWTEQAAAGVTGRDRLEVLPWLAKAAFRAGDLDAAQSYARELLQLAPRFTNDRAYGDALYDGYSVMGRVALRRDNLPLARQYLLDAASTPGSPSLNRNGPGMALAKDLLEKGQAPTVLRFFILCREFWKSDNGRLSAWSDAIAKHEIPDFSAYLDY
jgi:hypothetical protein